MLKEISIKEFSKEYSFIDIAKNWGVIGVSDGKEANAMTIGWGSFGILWGEPTFSAYVRCDRYTQHIMDGADAFSISLFDTKRHPKALMYLGTKSGADEDKLSGSGLKVAYKDDVPYFEDAKYVLFCSKMAQVDFDLDQIVDSVSIKKTYESIGGVHRIYEGKIETVLKA